MMSDAPGRRPELPAELAELGERLEAAARAEVLRRRAARRSLLKGTWVALVSIPLALAATTNELGPASEPVSEIARAESTPTAPFASNSTARADAARAAACASQLACRPPRLTRLSFGKVLPE